MKVKLIQITQSPIDVMWVAARTCYSSKSPVEMWDKIFDVYTDPDNVFSEEPEKQEAQHWNLVKKVLDSGHQSIAEHVYFTFAIEGVNRALTHQLVRHRIGVVYSQQSQRYVNEKSGFEFEVPQSIQKIDELHNEFYALMQHIQNFYNKAIEYDIKPEDARSVLPNAALSNITLSINLRELIHVCNLRLCTRAQLEIRNLFKEIVKCVKEQDDRLASYLVPQCEVNGFCTEKNCCGRRPSLKELKQDFLTKEEMKQLFKANENPQVNEKLQKLIKMRSVFS